MSSNILIGIWASGVWESIDFPTSLSALTISGYAVQPGTLGKLNSLIGTCYSGSGWSGAGTVNWDVVPDVSNTELAIIEQMFLGSYYSNIAKSVMGVDSSTMPWTRLREEASDISRGNPASAGAEYIKLARDARTEQTKLVNAYLTNSLGANVPRSIDFYNPPVGWVG